MKIFSYLKIIVILALSCGSFPHYLQSQQKDLTLSASPETALQTLIASGQQLLQDFKSKQIAFKTAQAQAYQDYNALEKVISAYKETPNKSLDQSLLDLADYVLLQLSSIFRLQTPVAQKIEQLKGTASYFSSLWNKLNKQAAQPLSALLNGIFQSKSWAQEQFKYIVDNISSFVSLEEVIELLTKGLGIPLNYLRELGKSIIMKKYNAHEPSQKLRSMLEEALGKSGITGEVILLESNSIHASAMAAEWPILGSYIISRPLISPFIAYHEVGHLYYQHKVKKAEPFIGYLIFYVLFLSYKETLMAQLVAKQTLNSQNSLNKFLLKLYASVLTPFFAPYLIIKPYSRMQEREADLFACAQLLKQNKPDEVLRHIANEYEEDDWHATNKERREYLQQCLLAHGISTNTHKEGNQKKDSPLVQAIKTSDTDTLLRLIKEGAEIR